MEWQARVKEVLERCEASLRALVAEAAQTGDYEAVLPLTSLARELARLGEVALRRGPTTESTKKQPITASARPENAPRPAGRSPRKRAPRVEGGSSAEYPRFCRKGRELLKIGWSKSSRSEYEHRVPKEAVDRVVATLAEAAAQEDLVRVDEWLKALEKRGGEPIPTYQVYVALAWLRNEGLIRQHGRKGYSLAGPLIGRDVTQRWDALQESAS